MNEIEYPVPTQQELREMYYPQMQAWDFSPELKASVKHIFSHPFNKYSKFYARNITDNRLKDMCKPAYLITLYYLDHPQQYQHELSNIAISSLIRMWKKFLGDKKRYEKYEFDSYMPTKMKMMRINGIHFMEMFLNEIRNNKMILLDSPEMIKHRDGKTLRENHRAGLLEGNKHFEYLANLE